MSQTQIGTLEGVGAVSSASGDSVPLTTDATGKLWVTIPSTDVVSVKCVSGCIGSPSKPFTATMDDTLHAVGAGCLTLIMVMLTVMLCRIAWDIVRDA